MSPTPSPSARRRDELGVGECLRLLATRSIGRIAFVVDGRPRIQPLNYALVDGSVVVRIAYGDTLDTLADRAPVAFEVDSGEITGRRIA